MENLIFVNKLIELRKANNLSLAFVAKYLRISVKDYMMIENATKSCSFFHKRKLARLYRVDYTDLTDDSRKLDFNSIGIEDSLIYGNSSFKINKYYFIIFFISLLLIGLLAVSNSFLGKDKHDLFLDNLNRISASEKSVIFIDNQNQLIYSGLYSKVANLEKVVKVRSNSNTTYLLTDDGIIHSDLTFNNNFLKKYNDIVDFEVDDNYLLLLLYSSKVKLIDLSTMKELEIVNNTNVKYINIIDGITYFIDDENRLFINDKSTQINDVIAIYGNDKLKLILDKNGSVKVLSGITNFNIHILENIKKIALGDDFIASLNNEGKVTILIDDNIISETVKKWSNILDIASYDNYLVATDGYKLFGVGDNTYNQFEENYAIIPTQLPAVSNINYEETDSFIKFTWNKINNAEYYSVKINTGTDFSSKLDQDSILIESSKFLPGKEYLLKIVAIGDQNRYLNSDVSELSFVYTPQISNIDENNIPPEDAITIPALLHLEKLTGKSKVNFEAYLFGLSVPVENFVGTENPKIICQNDYPVILSVEGISDYQEISKEELHNTKIKYTYCKVVNEELDKE